MAYSQAQNKATQKYHREHLEQINIRVKKGKKQEYIEKAKRKGLPLSRYICELIENDPE